MSIPALYQLNINWGGRIEASSNLKLFSMPGEKVELRFVRP